MFWKRPVLPVASRREIPLNTPMNDLTFTVFDTETTGFQIGSDDRMIEIGAVQVKNKEVLPETFQTLVNPKRSIPESITALTDISEEKVEEAPGALEAIEAFLQFDETGGGGIWVGHYVSFDLLVLKKEIQRHRYRLELPTTIDTLDLIGYLSPSQQMLDLEIYAAQFDSRIYERHRALGDALTTAHLFCELLYHLEERGKRTLADVLEISDMSKRNIQF